MTTDDFTKVVLARSQWHAWLYRWCVRVAKTALFASFVVLCVCLLQPVADLRHHQWAGLRCYATHTALLVLPVLGLSWVGWIICHTIYVRYQPA